MNSTFSIIVSALGVNLNKINSWLSSEIINKINEFIIVVQNSEGYEKEIKYLKDLGCKVIIDTGIGLSRSRNIGIKNCGSDFFWILDDDVYTNLNMIDSILDSIKSNVSDIYAFRISRDKDGKILYKSYSLKSKISKLGLLKISSIELIISKKIIDRNNIKFNQDFGLGSKYPMCEETLFLLDCYSKNAKITHIPKVIVVHKNLGSGYIHINNNSLVAKGYVCSKFYIIGLFLIFYWYYKMIVNFKNFNSIKYLFKGYYLKNI